MDCSVEPDADVSSSIEVPRTFSKFETSDFPTDKDIENWFI